MSDIAELKPFIRLTLASPRGASHSEFGRGIAGLCQGVKDTGSLNAAAKDMGMAYSKAWRIMKDTEQALGFSILNRNGAHGSTLTAQGEKLLEVYCELERRTQAAAEQMLLDVAAELNA